MRYPKISYEKKQECLKYFSEGCGYKKTATLTGLKRYTVRDYRRKFALGDFSWAAEPEKKDQDTTESLF